MTMRALVNRQGSVRVIERPVPEPPAGEALLRLSLAGICATDREIVQGYMGFEGVLGHEFVGVVTACADDSWLGKRVVGEINCPCGACPACGRGDGNHCPQRTTLGIFGRDGVFSDYFTLPVANLHPVPEGVTDRQAVFVEPLAAALEIADAVHVRPSDRVAVVGDGKLGLLTVQVLALTGCDPLLVGRHPERWSFLDGSGIRTVPESERPESMGADLVVECSGSAAGFETARRLVRPRGRLILKSTWRGRCSVDMTGLVVDEVTLHGSRCGPFAPALRLLARQAVRVEPLIEAVYGLERGVTALDRAMARGALKVLLRS